MIPTGTRQGIFSGGSPFPLLSPSCTAFPVLLRAAAAGIPSVPLSSSLGFLAVLHVLTAGSTSASSGNVCRGVSRVCSEPRGKHQGSEEILPRWLTAAKASVPEGILLKTNLCWLCPGQPRAVPAHPAASQSSSGGGTAGKSGECVRLGWGCCSLSTLSTSGSSTWTRCHLPREMPPAPG